MESNEHRISKRRNQDSATFFNTTHQSECQEKQEAGGVCDRDVGGGGGGQKGGVITWPSACNGRRRRSEEPRARAPTDL